MNSQNEGAAPLTDWQNELSFLKSASHPEVFWFRVSICRFCVCGYVCARVREVGRN